MSTIALSPQDSFELSLEKYIIQSPKNLSPAHLTFTARCLFRMYKFQLIGPKLMGYFNSITEDIHFNVYIGDAALKDYNENDCMLYVTLPIRHMDTADALQQLEEFLYYKDHYVLDINRIVVRLKYNSEQVFKHFVNSRFSKMFSLGEPDSKGKFTECFLTRELCIKHFICGYKYENKVKIEYIDPAYHIMLHSKLMFKHIIETLYGNDIPDNSLQKIIWENEFTDKLDLSKEILNYDGYNS